MIKRNSKLTLGRSWDLVIWVRYVAELSGWLGEDIECILLIGGKQIFVIKKKAVVVDYVICSQWSICSSPFPCCTISAVYFPTMRTEWLGTKMGSPAEPSYPQTDSRWAHEKWEERSKVTATMWHSCYTVRSKQMFL